VLAWLRYVLVEKPLRSGRANRAKTIVLLVLMVAVGAAGYEVYRRDGLGFRMKDRQEFAAYFENAIPGWQYFNRIGLPEKAHIACQFYDIEQYRAGNDTRIPRPAIAPDCYQRDPAKPHAVMLWGDSHAEHLSYGIRKNLPADWQVLQVASSGCPPEIDAPGPSTTDQCVQSNWFAQKTIAEAKPDVVIVAQNLGHTNARFQQISAALKRLGVKRIIYTGPDPHWTTDLPSLVLTRFWLHTPRRTFHGVNRELMDANAKLQAEFTSSGNDTLVDLMGVLCNQDGCLTYLGEDRMTGITSYDYGHLTPVASGYVAQQLLVKEITRAPLP